MIHPRLHNIYLPLLMAVLAACTQQVDEPLLPGKEISLFSRANEGDAATSAHLLFWKEADYSAFYSFAEGTTIGSPYAKFDMPQLIDTYKLSDAGDGTPFNTFKPYPSPTTTYVYASGFAPSNAYEKNFSSDGYGEIPIVEEKQDGLTDFLASNNDGTSRGSYDEPFIKDKDAAGLTEEQRNDIIAYNLERELKFRHLTACISFVAMRNESMYYKIGVRNVKVEIVNNVEGVKKLAVPQSIRLYHNTTDVEAYKKWTYVVGQETTPDKLTGYVPGDVLMVEGKQLAEFYVNTAGITYGEASNEFEPFDGLTARITAPTPKLIVNVEAQFFWVQDPTQTWEMRWENLEVTNWKVDGDRFATGDRFLPNYKYQVTINFNNTAIGLKAVQLPWEPGGTYYYPVWDKDETEP